MLIEISLITRKEKIALFLLSFLLVKKKHSFLFLYAEDKKVLARFMHLQPRDQDASGLELLWHFYGLWSFLRLCRKQF